MSDTKGHRGASLALPLPPARYDPQYEQLRNRVLEDADRQNYKHGRDVQVLAPQERLVLRATDTGVLMELTVDSSGVVTATPL